MHSGVVRVWKERTDGGEKGLGSEGVGPADALKWKERMLIGFEISLWGLFAARLD